MSNFRIEYNGIDVQALSLSIVHAEGQLPEIKFTAVCDLIVINSTRCTVFIESTKITAGTICKVKNDLELNEFQLIYDQYAGQKLNEDDYYDPYVEQKDYYLEYCNAKLKIANYRLLDGARIESDIIPKVYRQIKNSQCLNLSKRKLKSTIRSINAQISAHWRHIAEGSQDIRLNFVTYIPFLIQKNWPRNGHVVNSNIWIGYSDLSCVKTISKEIDGSINFGMELQARLIARWLYDYPVQETVNISVPNPLSCDLNQAKDIENIKYNVFPQIENCVFWESNYFYKIDTHVYFGYCGYTCTCEHTSKDWFEDEFWRKDTVGPLKERCYFISDRGRRSLRYIFNCIAGRLILNSRVNLTEIALPVKYLAQIQIGDAINIGNSYGVVSKILMTYRFSKSQLTIQIKGTDLCPAQISEQHRAGYIDATYAEDYAAEEKNMAKSEAGLEVNMPSDRDEARFKINYHHDQSTIINNATDQTIETFLLKMPTHSKNDYIVHEDLNVKWVCLDQIREVTDELEIL